MRELRSIPKESHPSGGACLAPLNPSGTVGSALGLRIPVDALARHVDGRVDPRGFDARKLGIRTADAERNLLRCRLLGDAVGLGDEHDARDRAGWQAAAFQR